MQTQSLSLWWLRTATFLLAALAAASAAYWVLKWRATTPPNPGAAIAYSAPTATDPRALARLLGGGQTALAATLTVSAASHFKLMGVVVDAAKNGYALIAIDGRPARPYRVGARLNDDLVLHSVAARSAALAASVEAPVSVTLDLPKLGTPP
jgi:general secretion pathway protein C